MRRRPWFNLLAVAAGLVVLALLALGHVRFYAARSLLPSTGSVSEHLPGLTGEVEVLFDSRGVPSVWATNERDLWFTQGYLHARDRFFVMDLTRRLSQGRLAELFGEAALPFDRKARTWQLVSAAKAQLGSLGPADRQVLERYAAGVNAALSRFGRWIAPETWLLFDDPQPWSVMDTVAVGVTLQFALSFAAGDELERAAWLKLLGRERIVDLWGWTPEQASRWIPPQEPGGEPIRDDDAVLPRYDGIGSNAWALAGSKSASGRPLLANDPHSPNTLPGMPYPMVLHAPDLHAAGASVAGLPGIHMGHNEQVAWGVTMLLLDDKDLFRLTLNPSGSQELIDGAWHDLRTVSERIEVRLREEPVPHKVQISNRGPIVRSSNRESLALAWTGRGGACGLGAILRMNRSRSVRELAAAWNGVPGPAVNLIAADVNGDIMHQVVGLVPNRGRGAGYLPAPGDGSHWAWHGLRSFSKNPRTIGSPTGFLANANHDIFSEGDYPESQRFSGVFYAPWRVRRIREVLRSRDDWDVAGCLQLQGDQVSARASQVLKMLRLDLRDHGGATAKALLQWDAGMQADRLEPHLFTRFMTELADTIGGDEAAQAGLGRTPFRPPQLLRILAGGLDEAWWDDVSTEETEDRAAIIARTLDRVDALNLQAPWGQVHQVRFTHPFAQAPVIGGLLDRLWSRGPYPTGGDAQTIDAYYPSELHPYDVTALPGMRLVVDVGEWDNTVLITTLGGSGRPWSAHYDDQLQGWFRNQPHLLPFSREAVERAARARLHLLPATPAD